MKKFTLLLMLLFTCFLFAEATKPKLGLVLSGEGAKGLAHIGVLKVLEEYNIKPGFGLGWDLYYDNFDFIGFSEEKFIMQGTALNVGIETPTGPIELSVMYNDQHKGEL
jgi:hypothetical protein